MLVTILLAALFAIIPAEAALFEALHNVPNDWYEVEMAPADKQIHFRIAMTEVGRSELWACLLQTNSIAEQWLAGTNTL